VLLNRSGPLDGEPLAAGELPGADGLGLCAETAGPNTVVARVSEAIITMPRFVPGLI